MALPPPPPPVPQQIHSHHATGLRLDKKDQVQVVRTGKEDTREITEEVEGGQIGRTETHKYLGILKNEKGDLEDHLKQKAKLSTSVLAQIKILDHSIELGLNQSESNYNCMTSVHTPQ